MTDRRTYIIVDIDGTVADASHRQPLVMGEVKDWDQFFDLCHLDKPIWPIINLVNLLARTHSIIFVSGRSNVVINKTVDWLHAHGLQPTALAMREHGDHRPDDQVKLEMLSQLMTQFLFNHDDIFLVLDDRDRVVEMWRKQGLTCLQVAPGAF